MRCALCGRGLQLAAVTIGKMPVGPICARRAGLVERARRHPEGWVQLGNGQRHLASTARRDPRTLDLFPVDENNQK